MVLLLYIAFHALNLPLFELVLLEDEPFDTGDISAMFKGEKWNWFNELVSAIPLPVSPYTLS